MIRNLNRIIHEKDEMIAILRAQILNLEQQIVNFNPRNFYFQLSEAAQKKIKKKIKQQIEILNTNIEGYGIMIEEIKIVRFDRENELEKKISIIIFDDLGTINIDVANALFLKDKYLISDIKYNIIRNKLKADIPSLKRIKRKRKELNIEFIYRFPNLGKSCFTDIKVKIQQHLIKYLTGLSDFTIQQRPKLRIKFSADGTNIGKNLKLVNFVFTIPNDSKMAKGVFGNITIGIAEIEESYGSLAEPMNYIMTEIKDYNNITFNDNIYEIEYFFSADLKFLLEVNGIYAASGNYPCLWCVCHKDNLSELGYSILDDLQARNNDKCQEILRKKVKREHLGYKSTSLLSEIPFKKCVPDTLHTRLRIPGVLIKLLITKLAILDQYEGTDLINEGHKNLTIWYKFLTITCKIKLKLRPYVRDSSCGITKDLTGKQIKKVLKKINFKKLFPTLNSKETIQRIWKGFYEIDKKISKNIIDYPTLKTKTENWMKDFLSIYTKDNVTPYMHIFVNHFHEFLRLYGDLSVFSEQGMNLKIKFMKNH